MVRVFWTNYRAYKSKTNVILNLFHNSIENCPTRKLIVAWREKLWADVVNMKMIFHSFSNATHFHLKSLALSRIKLYSKTIVVFLSLKLQLNFFKLCLIFCRATMKDEMCNFYMMYWYDPKLNDLGGVSVEDMCQIIDERQLDFPSDSDVPLPGSGPKMEMKRNLGESRWFIQWNCNYCFMGNDHLNSTWEYQSVTYRFFFLFFIKPLLAVGLAICRIFVVVNGFRFQVVFKRLRIVWVKFPVGYRLSRVFSESFRFYMGGFGYYAEGFDGAFLFFQFHLIFSARLTLLLSLSSFWPRNPSRCRAKQSADFFFVSFLLIAGQLWWKW